MTGQRPSRLPSVYAGVSRCPICAYSLRDLGRDLPCPECGSVIDVEVLTSPEMHDAVAGAKTWCTIGMVAWAICGFAYWAGSMAHLSVINGYYPGTYGPNHFAGVWCRTAVVIAPIALSASWFRNARRMIYRIAMERASPAAKTPRRVILVNLLGIALLTGGCSLSIILSEL